VEVDFLESGTALALGANLHKAALLYRSAKKQLNNRVHEDPFLEKNTSIAVMPRLHKSEIMLAPAMRNE
jgi:hypothetical protein